MDNPHAAWVLGQADLDRKREVADLARLHHVLHPVQERTGMILLRGLGIFLVRFGMKLVGMGMPSTGRTDQHVDLEALVNASRQAA